MVSNLTLRHQKISKRCREPVFRPKPMRPFLIYVRVLYPSVSVGRLVGKYAIHRFPFRTDGIRCLSYLFPIHSACFQFFALKVYSLLLKVLVFLYCRMDCGGANISPDVFRCGVDSAHLFDLQSDE